MKDMLNDGVTLYLPDEIIAYTLKRLPVKSLVRFQCVCKQWKYLIKLPSFIADHLHHSSHQNPSLLFQLNLGSDPSQLCLLDCGMQVHEVKYPMMGSSHVIGSSNGLVCVEFDDYDTAPCSLFLWNPVMREFRQVPRNYHGFKGINHLGFGFSPVINDYKLVRIYANLDGLVNRVEVYALSIGLWKEIDLGNIEGVTLLPKTVTANGCMFWFGFKPIAGGGEVCVIVSFDIAREVFILIPMPRIKCEESWKSGFARLMVYENKVAVLWDMMIGDFKSFFVNLCVMEEVSGASRERWSWTTKCTSKPYPHFMTPVTIWRDEIVSIVDLMIEPFTDIEYEVEHVQENTILCMFNINTGKFKWFTIQSHSPGQYITNYVESLVPVGNVYIKEP